MSTNYYFRDKNEFANYTEINKKIDEKIDSIIADLSTIVTDEYELSEIRSKIENASHVSYEMIHIGKRSVGWKPLFQKNEGFSSVAELKIFYEANREKYEIVNEYGDVFDWDGLKNELIDWNGSRRDTGHDIYLDTEGYAWTEHEFS